MKNAILYSFIFLGIYAFSALLGFNRAALLLFSLSPVVVVYVAYKILKDDTSVEKTFENSFYQDSNYRRNNR